MKARILIMFIFLSFTVFSQNVSMLKITVFEDDFNKPTAYKEAILYNGQKVLGNSFSDDNGIFTFIVDSLPFKSDSVYFIINTGDTFSNNTKIFINNLRLLESNKVGKHSIKITGFMCFTKEEYTWYSKKYGLMPRRKKNFSKRC